jgi:hypothetical protein
MDLILEKRDAVITENNTAQNRLLDILENLPKSSEVLEISEELHGDLDFSIIKDFEMGNLKSIILNKGEITSIIGLPNNIIKLVCANNFLMLLENLPITLEILNISYNYLEKIDIGYLQVLQTLNISHNRITELTNIPTTITELLCDNNKLGEINLIGLENLKILNISNNPITIIENLPEGVVQFTMENTPNIEFRNSALDAIRSQEDIESNKEKDNNDKQQINYKEALSEFFHLKQEYETKVRKMKHDAYNKAPTKKLGRTAVLSVKPACIHCKRPVGTIFSNRIDNKYTILCGDNENPCKLNVQIFNGGGTYFEDLLYTFRDHLDEIKVRIIRQKLDTIFSYVSEEKSIELFKKELQTYNSDSNIYKELLDVYTDYYHNKQNKEKAIKKNQIIFGLNEKVQLLMEEYEQTQNPELLTLAVRTQINEIYPEIRNKRMLENEVTELDSKLVSNKEIFSIFKYPIEISKLDYHVGEQPRVINYIV